MAKVVTRCYSPPYVESKTRRGCHLTTAATEGEFTVEAALLRFATTWHGTFFRKKKNERDAVHGPQTVKAGHFKLLWDDRVKLVLCTIFVP